MTNSKPIVSSQVPLTTEQKSKGRGNKIVVGTAVKAKIGELEEEVRVGKKTRTRIWWRIIQYSRCHILTCLLLNHPPPNKDKDKEEDDEDNVTLLINSEKFDIGRVTEVGSLE